LPVLILEPPEALAEGAFDFPFHRVHFIAGNPLLPLKLRIRKAPRLGNRGPWHAFSFLHLQVLVVWNHLSLWIGKTVVGPEIIRPCLWWCSSIAPLHLHHFPISMKPWSIVVEILHGSWLGRENNSGFSLYLLKLIPFLSKFEGKVSGSVGFSNKDHMTYVLSLRLDIGWHCFTLDFYFYFSSSNSYMVYV